MTIPYHAFSRSVTSSAESRTINPAIAATRTFRQSRFLAKAGKLLARIAGTIRRLAIGPSSASEAYAIRHPQDVETLNRLARYLETSQPARAAELMLLANGK